MNDAELAAGALIFRRLAMSRRKAARKSAYPYPVAEVLLKPVIGAVKKLVAGGTVTRIVGAVKLHKPVHHVADASLPFDADEAVERLVFAAFQYGICQGYAMRDGEAEEYKWPESIRRNPEAKG